MTEVSITTPCERTLKIKAVDIGGGLSVYSRATVMSEVRDNGSRKELSVITSQGVVDDDNLERLVSGDPDFTNYAPYLIDGENDLRPFFVTDSGREHIRIKGNPLSYSNLWEQMTSAGMIYANNSTPFVDLAEMGLTTDNLFFRLITDHSLVDVSGRPMMQAHHFDYMSGYLHEESYDLEMVSEVLSANPEVTIEPEREGGSPISTIPYYNVTTDCGLQVVAKWVPTKDSWNDLVSRIGYDPENPRHIRITPELVIGKLDMLGLEACRKVSSDYNR